MALAYAKAGYQTFVLRYTLKDKGGWPMPLEDYEQAMALMEKNAEVWHIATDRIAVVGFSAGGHLAACSATMAKRKPAAAVLVYAGILRDVADMCQPNMPCPNEFVDGNTSPCFLAAARNPSCRYPLKPLPHPTCLRLETVHRWFSSIAPVRRSFLEILTSYRG